VQAKGGKGGDDHNRKRVQLLISREELRRKESLPRGQEKGEKFNLRCVELKIRTEKRKALTAKEKKRNEVPFNLTGQRVGDGKTCQGVGQQLSVRYRVKERKGGEDLNCGGKV